MSHLYCLHFVFIVFADFIWSDLVGRKPLPRGLSKTQFNPNSNMDTSTATEPIPTIPVANKSENDESSVSTPVIKEKPKARRLTEVERLYRSRFNEAQYFPGKWSSYFNAYVSESTFWQHKQQEEEFAARMTNREPKKRVRPTTFASEAEELAYLRKENSQLKRKLSKSK